MTVVDEPEATTGTAASLDAGARLRALLGLRVDPFDPDSLRDFFFVGGQRRYLVQQAVHQICFGAATALLIGDSGMGKSRLLTEVVTELDGLADRCRVDATVMTDEATLRAALVAALGLRSDYAVDTARFIDGLLALRPLAAEPVPLVLLIDDAHLLAPPILTACAELVAAAGGRLRLLLAGDRSLLAHWRDAPACAEPGTPTVARLDLEPLDQRESVDYLRTRLQVAGLRGALPLSSAGERQLYRLSGGSFAAIQSVAPDLLLAALQPGSSRVRRGGGVGPSWLSSRRLRVMVGGALALLAGVVVLAALTGSDDELQQQDTAVVMTPGGRDRVPLVLSWDRSPVEAGEQASAARVAPAAEAPAAPRSADPAPAEHQPAQEQATTPLPVNPAGPVQQSTPVSAPTPAPAPAAGEASSVAPAATRTDDEQALLAMDEDAFVIQLMGARSLQQLKQSVITAGVGGRVFYVETRLAGKPWFVALQGPYPQHATVAAIAALPAQVRNAKPWPKRLSAVHADIQSPSR